ncbi:ankyrin repeat-containing domain protein [Cladochytrium replicatum]|nr:ankyrin repeat-containing domain protein [Cladochytrium replicatum]
MAATTLKVVGSAGTVVLLYSLYVRYSKQRAETRKEDEERKAKEALFAACRSPVALAEFKVLLSRFQKQDIRDVNGLTPFMMACEANNIELVRYLVSTQIPANTDASRHAFFRTRNVHGLGSVHVAVTAGAADVLRYLLSFNTIVSLSLVGSRVGVEESPSSSTSGRYGTLRAGGPSPTPASSSASLSGGSQGMNGSMDIESSPLLSELTGWPTVTEVRSGIPGVVLGATCLHIAVAIERLDMMEILLKYRADVHAQDDNGVTPLMLSLTSANSATAERLITATSSPGPADIFRRTALYYECTRAGAAADDDRFVRRLLAGRMKREPEKQKTRAGNLARTNSNSSMRSTKSNPSLSGVDPLSITTRDEGYTVLHAAILHGRTAAASLLVELMSATDVGLAAADGRTALHLAVETANVDIVKKIAQRLHDGIREAATLKDGQGRTPADLARSTGSQEVEELLSRS